MRAFGCTNQHSYCAKKSEMCERPSLGQSGRDFRTKSIFAKYTRSPVLNTQAINRMDEGFIAGLCSTQVEAARGGGGRRDQIVYFPTRSCEIAAGVDVLVLEEAEEGS